MRISLASFRNRNADYQRIGDFYENHPTAGKFEYGPKLQSRTPNGNKFATRSLLLTRLTYRSIQCSENERAKRL